MTQTPGNPSPDNQADESEKTNVFYLVFAYLCVILGLIGAFLPIMPTTPFLILAAWAAPRGSPRLHHWLYTHKTFGPPLRAWDENRAVATRAKWMACTLMTASWFIMLYMTEGWLVPSITGVIFVSVGTYLITRPTPSGDYS